MKAIFLDIDGVLINEQSNNNVKEINEEKIKLLKTIVEATNAKIILISNWRKFYQKETNGKKNPYNELIEILNKYNLSIYDRTKVFEEQKLSSKIDKETGLKIIELYDDIHKTRAAEVNDWIINHEELESFIILDDENLCYDYFDFEENFIQTDRKQGLTEEECIIAIETLNKSIKKIR